MPLRTPPLRDDHAELDARFTEFNGWEMPVEFGSIRDEHESVREAVGKFDVSHMGQVTVAGPDAAELLDRLTTNDVAALDPGEAQYAAITDEDGVILDDTVVYCLPEGATASGDDAGGDAGDVPSDRVGAGAQYLFVPNAGNDEAMYDRWADHRDRWGLDATVENVTTDCAMIAVQGPDAEDELAGAVTNAAAVRDLDSFAATDAAVAGVDCLVARTGYTGEDGFEVLCPSGGASAVWNAVDAQPCGLGARDTLRVEMGFLLSGQDFHPEENPRNPYEAGIGFTVALDTEFVGRDALARVAETGPEERFVGLRLLDRGVPRHGYEVVDEDGSPVGEVTSGTMSPTLGEPIGLGYLPAEFAAPDTRVGVVIRGEPKTATTVTPPFIGGN